MEFNANDAALIFKEDGAVELMIPNQEEETEVKMNVLVAVATLRLMDDDAFRKMLTEQMDELFAEGE